MARRRARTESDLEAMKQIHLEYELRMLQAAASILAEPEPDVGDIEGQVRRFMAIECFYLHLRNLDQFFYEVGGKRSKKDAFAVDFFNDPMDWRKRAGRPKRSTEMKEAVELAGTMVAHLSYERQTAIEAGKKLKWLKLAREMDSVFKAFRAALKSEHGIVALDREFSITPRSIPPSVDESFATATTTTSSVFEVQILNWRK